MPRPRNAPDIIDGKAVKSLVEAQALRGATVLGQPGGWAVLVRYGALERAVAAQRARQPRLWRNLNAAASYVRDELLLPRFEVDSIGHEPDAIDRSRPDTAARQRQMRAAAAHDAWFRAQVEDAMIEADDPATVLVSHEDAKRSWAIRKAELQVLAGQGSEP